MECMDVTSEPETHCEEVEISAFEKAASSYDGQHFDCLAEIMYFEAQIFQFVVALYCIKAESTVKIPFFVEISLIEKVLLYFCSQMAVKSMQ
mmetsp:Transcript_37647/g.78817  ORF Transcript_37647/g.78817 Transcript_37647/m.78817 type:complete len:92 (+) Transcript_37647:818-1093(+)